LSPFLLLPQSSSFYDEVAASFTRHWMKPRIKRKYKEIRRRHGWIYPCSNCARNTWRIAYQYQNGEGNQHPIYLCSNCYCLPTFDACTRKPKKREENGKNG
jgi:hypothetical protein